MKLEKDSKNLNKFGNIANCRDSLPVDSSDGSIKREKRGSNLAGAQEKFGPRGAKVHDIRSTRPDVEAQVFSIASNDKVAPCRHMCVEMYSLMRAMTLKLRGMAHTRMHFLGLRVRPVAHSHCWKRRVQGAQLLEAGQRRSEVISTRPQNRTGAVVQMAGLIEVLQHESNWGSLARTNMEPESGQP